MSRRSGSRRNSLDVWPPLSARTRSAGGRLHLTGIARSLLPAQDGLKFLRTARDFQSKPWIDVIRGSDQHPLYPALVAVSEPIVAAINGNGPDTWRIAAQAVASLASLALLIPLFGLTRDLFDARIALVAVLIYVVLPLPAAIGHDTLSDSVALFAALLALWLGEISLRSTGWKRRWVAESSRDSAS